MEEKIASACSTNSGELVSDMTTTRFFRNDCQTLVGLHALMFHYASQKTVRKIELSLQSFYYGTLAPITVCSSSPLSGCQLIITFHPHINSRKSGIYIQLISVFRLTKKSHSLDLVPHASLTSALA